MLKLAAAILIFPFITYGEPVRLLANQPFTPKESGWYFNDADERTLRARLVEADYIEKQLKLETDLNGSLRKLADENAKLAEVYYIAFINENDEVIKMAKRQAFNHWLYLGLGISLTVLAGFAIGYAAKGIR